MSEIPATDDIKAWRAVLFTDAGQAAVAQLWCEGVPQKTIARAFRYPSAPMITVAIEKFVRKWLPEQLKIPTIDPSRGLYILKYGAARKALVPEAISRFRSSLIS